MADLGRWLRGDYRVPDRTAETEPETEDPAAGEAAPKRTR
jgi:endogenous inhibitor of DNA gyrase (YacG/DUF329 family)